MIDYIGETRINYNRSKTKIKESNDVFGEVEEFKDKLQEHFIVLYLDGANCIIESRVISMGTVNQSLVHPREVFAPALKENAVSIIIVHNHPSGVLEPSTEDLQVTKRLLEAGKLLGIKLLDHVIISVNGYLSFKDEDLI